MLYALCNLLHAYKKKYACSLGKYKEACDQVTTNQNFQKYDINNIKQYTILTDYDTYTYIVIHQPLIIRYSHSIILSQS